MESLRIREWICLGLVLAALGNGALHAAKPVPPPLDSLQRPPVVVTEFEFLAAAGESKARLLDANGQETQAILDHAALARLAPGGCYHVATVSLMRSPQEPKRWVHDPAGARVLVQPGLEPALFACSEKARRWLAPAAPGALDTRAHLLAMLALLSDADPQWQNLAAGELALRAPLRRLYRRSDARILKNFVLNPDAPDPARALLLQAAAEVHPAMAGDWWRAALPTLAAQLPVHREAPDRADALAWMVLDLIARQDIKVPLASLQRWLSAGNGSLAERALAAVRLRAPELERSWVESTLEQSLLAPSTREFLGDHLRRLDAASPTEQPRS